MTGDFNVDEDGVRVMLAVVKVFADDKLYFEIQLIVTYYYNSCYLHA